MKLTQIHLRKIMPHLSEERLTLYFPHLAAAMEEAKISTPARAAAFLAQAAHESAELARLEENLMYSAAGLLKTWPKRFTRETAQRYHRRPAKIANYVYANRMGNGPPESGDGWRYRGRGIFQLTGKDNYGRAGKELGLPLLENPDLVAYPEAACRTAAWYWRSRGLNDQADQGKFRDLTRKINPGLLGLAEREAYWLRAMRVLGAEAQ